MCYPKPGPRCSAHAKQKYLKARENHKKLLNTPNTPTHQILHATHLLNKAREEYDTTPAGQKRIQKQIQNPETDSNQKNYLQKRLEKAQQTRQQQLTEYKNTQQPDPTPTINLIATPEEIQHNLENKLIRKQTHPNPNIPYDIYDYTEHATFGREWNNVTTSARGLIINRETGEIIARPFPKFFNDSEPAPGWNDFPRTGPVQVYDKADGSCGIMYQLPNGTPQIATRGSMNSEQAQHANTILAQKYSTYTPPPNTTMMFEIIYPENRIVLNYGNMDDLILLGGVNKTTGETLPLDELAKTWPGPVVQKYDYATYTEALQAPIPTDREGYVIHFQNNDKRVKLKGAEYLRLHKVITNATPRRVWELLASGDDIETWLRSGVPDEFADWAREKSKELNTQHETHKNNIHTHYNNTLKHLQQTHPNGHTPKDFALHVQQNIPKEYISFMFTLNQNQPITEGQPATKLWNLIKPPHEKPTF